MKTRMTVLHVEDDQFDALLLADLLHEGGHKEIVLTRAETLFKARALLKERAFDLVLLDLVLPDERGINTLLSVRCSAPKLPVVVLTSLSDFGTATEAIASGAEDYSVKGRDTAQELARKMYCAIERHRNRLTLHARMAEVSMENSQLHDLAERDPLTSLLNRRGLDLRLHELAHSPGPAFAILLDVDDFKRVNDTLGHQVGDSLLCEVARCISGVEAQDLATARVGGDEFLLVGLGDKAVSAAKAKELRESLAGSALLATALPRHHVTCCQALVAMDRLAGHAIPDLLADAHDALARAKHQGKDRIIQGWDLPARPVLNAFP